MSARDELPVRVLEALSEEDLEALREIDPGLGHDRRHPREVSD
jgi:hypothetical protein